MPMVRVLRSNTTLLRLALKRVMRMTASQREQIPEDLAAFQRLVLEAMIDERAHQCLRLLLSLGIGIVVARHGVPQLLEQSSLERTQRRGRPALRREFPERFPVSRKQGVVRVLAG